MDPLGKSGDTYIQESSDSERVAADRLFWVLLRAPGGIRTDTYKWKKQARRPHETLGDASMACA